LDNPIYGKVVVTQLGQLPVASAPPLGCVQINDCI